MEFIYRRVSTAEQNVDRQLPELPYDEVYEDKLSGKDMDRPQLQQLLKRLRGGDVIHVHELSRLGRSVKDLLETVDTVVAAGASVHFHKENLHFKPNKDDPFQKLMLNMLSAVAQFERECILQRQREGIAIAKAKGKYKGKQSKFSDEELEHIRADFKRSSNKAKLAKRWGVSRSYLYKIAASS